MSAFDKAVAAGLVTGVPIHKGYIAEVIDAIPADVLAQLAIERGGLIQVDEWSSTARRGIPLYRLVTP